MGETALGQARSCGLDDWEMASRLSYLLWSRMPDDALFAAAEAGELATDAEIAAQAQRMLADPQARAAVADFHDQWLASARLTSSTRTRAFFPG